MVRLTQPAPADFPDQASGYRVLHTKLADPAVSPRFNLYHAIVPHTGGTATKYVDLTAQPGRMQAHATTAYNTTDGNRLTPASHPAYAQTW